MAHRLSQEDVKRLLSDASPATRADMVTKVAEELADNSLTETERRLAEDILRILARDVALRVRKALAESLVKATNIPRDLAMTLARDVDNVALPLLRTSQVFTDEDLIAIVRQKSVSKQEAIAARPVVSIAVSDAIIAEGAERAVAVLMANGGALISDQGYAQALDRFGESIAVNEPMARRTALPTIIVERLIALVSDDLKHHLLASNDLPADMASDLLVQARERATAALLIEDSGADTEKLVQQMADTGRLTPTLILRMLCLGDLAFFEAALAQLAHVTLPSARTLIHDAGPLGLKSIYERARLPDLLLPAVRVTLEVLQETDFDGLPGDQERRQRRILERILSQYSHLGSGDLDYLLSKLGVLSAT